MATTAHIEHRDGANGPAVALGVLAAAAAALVISTVCPSGIALTAGHGVSSIQLARVNQKVNAAYAPGMPWDDPADGRFDCENYAFTKRDELAKLGVPSSDMRVWGAVTPWGEVHAVLIVQTPKGPVALDNLQNWPVRWDLLHYTGWKPYAVTRNPAKDPGAEWASRVW